MDFIILEVKILSYEQNNIQDEEINIDENKLQRLKVNLVMLERENLKTKELKYGEMVDKIRKAIEEEVNKCY